MEFTSDADEGGFVVPFPELPGCISMGDTLEETYKNAMAAKKVWLEATIEEGVTINESDDVENYSGQFKLRIPKILHKSLAERSKQEGISMNQCCLYLLSKNDAVHAGQLN